MSRQGRVDGQGCPEQWAGRAEPPRSGRQQFSLHPSAAIVVVVAAAVVVIVVVPAEDVADPVRRGRPGRRGVHVLVPRGDRAAHSRRHGHEQRRGALALGVLHIGSSVPMVVAVVVMVVMVMVMMAMVSVLAA